MNVLIIILIAAGAMFLFGILAGLFPGILKKTPNKEVVISARKLVLKTALILIAAGVIFFFIGFAMAGFKMQGLRTYEASIEI